MKIHRIRLSHIPLFSLKCRHLLAKQCNVKEMQLPIIPRSVVRTPPASGTVLDVTVRTLTLYDLTPTPAAKTYKHSHVLETLLYSMISYISNFKTKTVTRNIVIHIKAS